jgi:hypothetical protein
MVAEKSHPYRAFNFALVDAPTDPSQLLGKFAGNISEAYFSWKAATAFLVASP